jgi:hypothetical protein
VKDEGKATGVYEIANMAGGLDRLSQPNGKWVFGLAGIRAALNCHLTPMVGKRRFKSGW